MLVTTVLTSEWRRSCLSLQTHARNTSPNHLGSMSLNFSHQEKSSETVKRKCYFIFNKLYVHDDEFLFNLYLCLYFPKKKILFSINDLENKVPFIVFIKYWSLTVYKSYIPK